MVVSNAPAFHVWAEAGSLVNPTRQWRRVIVLPLNVELAPIAVTASGRCPKYSRYVARVAPHTGCSALAVNVPSAKVKISCHFTVT